MTNLTNAVLDWNVENLLNCLPLAIIGALLLLTPNLTRRGLLFAVPVSPVFLASDDARHAIFIFRRSITIALAVALLIAYQGAPRSHRCAGPRLSSAGCGSSRFLPSEPPRRTFSCGVQ